MLVIGLLRRLSLCEKARKCAIRRHVKATAGWYYQRFVYVLAPKGQANVATIVYATALLSASASIVQRAAYVTPRARSVPDRFELSST